MSAPAAGTEWVVYTADCGECGGKGGHPVGGPEGWEDCPHCKQVEDCAFCGDSFNCCERIPDVLLCDGRPQPVCPACFGLEPDEVDL